MIRCWSRDAGVNDDDDSVKLDKLSSFEIKLLCTKGWKTLGDAGDCKE